MAVVTNVFRRGDVYWFRARVRARAALRCQSGCDACAGGDDIAQGGGRALLFRGRPLGASWDDTHRGSQHSLGSGGA